MRLVKRKKGAESVPKRKKKAKCRERERKVSVPKLTFLRGLVCQSSI